MPVADKAGPAVREPSIRHLGQEGFGFRLDRLGQQAAGAGARHRGQRVVDRLGLRERDTVLSSFTAYRSPREVLAGW
jgi:hypothetical protein